MTGFLDLPQGVLRMLQVADIVDQKFIYPKFDAITDVIQNQFTATQIFGPQGILITDSTQNQTEGEILSLKAPKDRTWYLLKFQMHAFAPNPAGTATWQWLDFEVDGKSLQPESFQVANAFQTFWGSNFANSSPTPVQISSNDALPIRDHISLAISCTTQAVLLAACGVYFWVWETYKTTPVKDKPTVTVAQTVNESWQ